MKYRPTTLTKIVLPVCIFFSASSHATEFGFGATLKNNKSTIYVPIKTSSLIIEPSIRYSSFSRDFNAPGTTSSSSSSQFNNSTTSSSSTTGTSLNGTEIESSNLQIGIGLFKSRNFEKGFSAYYGARVGYIQGENEMIFSTTNNSTNSTSGSTSTSAAGSTNIFSSKSKESGYFFAPTIGLKYTLFERFSVSLESALFYSNTDAKSSNSDNRGNTNSSSSTSSSSSNTQDQSLQQSGNGKNTSTSTQETEIILRYMF